MDAYVEKEIIERISHGDEAAFTQLFNEHRSAIYKTALHITGSPDASEDVLQEVFMIIWQNRRQLGYIENFSAYIKTIARNQISRSFKRLANHRSAIKELSGILDAHRDDTEDVVQGREFDKLLRNAVATLSPRQAAVYALIRDKGFSREQAALKLGLYPETVKSHLEIAMKKIRMYCLNKLTQIFL